MFGYKRLQRVTGTTSNDTKRSCICICGKQDERNTGRFNRDKLVYWLNVIRLEDSRNWTRLENNERVARGWINGRTRKRQIGKAVCFR